MESRIKALREEKHISQSVLGKAVGTSQQNISKIEKNIEMVSIDLLISLSEFFHVSTDYILGVSDVKRTLEGQDKMVHSMEEYCELIENFKDLMEDDRKAIMRFIGYSSKINKE